MKNPTPSQGRRLEARRPGVWLATTVLLGLGAAGWLSPPRPAEALVRGYTFESLVRSSSRIVSGTVEQLHSYRAPFAGVGEVIFTDVVLRVDATLKGDGGDEYLFVQVLGGGVDDVVLRCPDSPRYEKGERVLVFLRPYNGKLWNTGWYQGKYRLSDDGSKVLGRKGLPLEETTGMEELKLRIDRLLEPSSSQRAPLPGAPGEGAGS